MGHQVPGRRQGLCASLGSFTAVGLRNWGLSTWLSQYVAVTIGGYRSTWSHKGRLYELLAAIELSIYQTQWTKIATLLSLRCKLCPCLVKTTWSAATLRVLSVHFGSVSLTWPLSVIHSYRHLQRRRLKYLPFQATITLRWTQGILTIDFVVFCSYHHNIMDFLAVMQE